MEDKVKFQHYVPRVYLKNFAQNKKGQYYLYCFDKLLSKSYGINISQIACDKEFYDTCEDEQITEKILREIETDFDKAIRKIIENKDITKLDSKEKIILSKFIATQFIRTKEARKKLEEIPKKILERFGGNIEPNFKKEIEDSLIENNIRTTHKKIISKTFLGFASILLQMKWILVINKSSESLITSDNPITLYNSLPTPPFLSNLGLKCKGIQLYFPINPYLNLIICDPIEYALLPNKALLSDIQTVIFSNDLQTLSSTRYLFSIKDDFLDAKKRIKETPEVANPNRDRMKII